MTFEEGMPVRVADNIEKTRKKHGLDPPMNNMRNNLYIIERIPSKTSIVLRYNPHITYIFHPDDLTPISEKEFKKHKVKTALFDPNNLDL